MPNKLTDNEIKKALDEAELFLRNRVMDGMSLKLNEYDVGILRNISQVCAKAYDEINRLQAENIALNRRAIPSSGHILKVGNALLFAENKEDYDITINAIKAEAYKEFAEKLHEELRMYGTKDKFNKVVFLSVVDKAKKRNGG